jgi:hypothetical protein
MTDTSKPVGIRPLAWVVVLLPMPILTLAFGVTDELGLGKFDGWVKSIWLANSPPNLLNPTFDWTNFGATRIGGKYDCS